MSLRAKFDLFLFLYCTMGFDHLFGPYQRKFATLLQKKKANAQGFALGGRGWVPMELTDA